MIQCNAKEQAKAITAGGQDGLNEKKILAAMYRFQRNVVY